MHRRLVTLLSTLAVAGLVLIACDDDEPSAEEAHDAYCGALERLGLTLGSWQDIDATSTVDSVQSLRDETRDGVDEVVEAAEDVAEAEVNELEAAYDDLQQAVEDIEGEDTLAEAFQGVRPAAEAVDAQWEQLSSAQDCP